MKIGEKIREIIETEIQHKAVLAKDGPYSAKVIAICSQKGGVGKTTTAINLASALAQHHNQKTLLLDLDPQGHVEKSLSSIIEEGLDYSPLSDIMLAKKGDLLEGVVRTKLEALHITPGDNSLYQTEGMLTAKIGREFILNHALKKARSEYQTIIIDCPPNLGNLTVNALCAADHIIIPCEMSVLAFEGVSDLLDTVETVKEKLNPKLKVLGVLFTRVDRRNVSMNKMVKDAMRQQFKGDVFQSEIHINTDLNRAQLNGYPIHQEAPRSSGALSYKKLADEVMGRLDKNKTQRGRALKKKKQTKN
ncbi:MAG: ParA family protein [Deltaproteobacteria bacterium]|nr:ParA family protein [Deltaproteobacteria bacterium]